MSLFSSHAFYFLNKGDFMKITAIIPQKRNKSFYNIHIDNEYFCSLDDETLYHLKLKEGLEVDKELLMQASREANYRKAMNYSLNVLAKYYKTKYEIAKKLKEKDYADDTINAVISRLAELGYLNDENYVEAYLRSKQDTSQGLNKRTLFNKLAQKGVDKELIQQCLDNANIDEYQNAMDISVKKLQSLKGDSRAKKSKLYSFLLYKGFDYEICSKVINNINIAE